MSNESIKHLADFLNHGILPFVGRDAERERLHQFWQQTIDAQNLRTLLLVGEAGIGKSRLVEEAMPRIIASGGAVIHAKLYPESSTTITPLLARSLWHSAAGRELLKKEPENSRDSLVESLRHIASLRPTLVVIEDIHLLSSEGVRETAAIFESLCDETISFLAASRPSMQHVRSILERYLTDEIRLEGLDTEAFHAVCSRLFDGAIDTEVVTLLQEATLGNSLALRSALRGALKSGYLARKDGATKWRTTVSPDAFARQLDQNVRSLSEGMAAHIPDDEGLACERLAVLGELFSFEAAEALLPNAKQMLDRLAFQGMLVTSSSAHTPICGSPSSFPLYAFSHSLLHRYFLGRTRIPADDLVTALATDIPLYGIAAFLQLADAEVTLDVSVIHAVILKADEAARDLDGSSDWELALQLWAALKQFFERHRHRWSEPDAKRIEILLLKTHLMLLRRQLLSSEYTEALEELFAATEDQSTYELADQRMAAYVFKHWQIDRELDPEPHYVTLRAQVEDLLARHPNLSYSHTYTVYLSYEAKAAAQALSLENMRRVEAAASKILANESITPRLRAIVTGYIYPHFLVIFDTKQELDARLELASRIEESKIYDNIMFPIRKTELLSAIGRTREALAELNKYIPQFRREGLAYTVFLRRLDVLTIEACYGKPLDEVLTQMRELFSDIPEDMRRAGRQAVTRFLIPVGVLLGASEFLRTVLAEFGDVDRSFHTEYYLLAALTEGEDPQPLLSACTQPERMAAFYHAAQHIRPEAPASSDAMVAEARIILEHDIVQQRDVLCALIAIEILRRCSRDAEVTEEIRDAITRMLEWFATDEITGCLKFVIGRYGSYLLPKDARSWKARITKFAKLPSLPTAAARGDGKLHLSMLGTIEIVNPDGTSARVRGARLRSVLGVMTANLMLDDPLSVSEFRLIAAGEKEDAELARKSVNMAIAALRDDLGADAIVTTGETPALNLDRVKIDVLEASDLLHDASRAVRRGSLVKALPDLTRALDLALGKVPFPTLYDNLFEAIRDDFDARIRKVTLEVGRRLANEGDRYSAINLLKKYFDAIPDDQEVATLLKGCLEAVGQRAEAERINIKVSMQNDR